MGENFKINFTQNDKVGNTATFTSSNKGQLDSIHIRVFADRLAINTFNTSNATNLITGVVNFKLPISIIEVVNSSATISSDLRNTGKVRASIKNGSLALDTLNLDKELLLEALGNSKLNIKSGAINEFRLYSREKDAVDTGKAQIGAATIYANNGTTVSVNVTGVSTVSANNGSKVIIRGEGRINESKDKTSSITQQL